MCPHLFILDMHGCNELKQRSPIKGSTKHKPHLQLHVLGQSLTQPRLADTEFTFLDMQVSLAPTHVSPSVGPLVDHTFGFPISGQ